MTAPKEDDSRLAYRMVIEAGPHRFVGVVYDESDVACAECASDDKDELIALLWDLWETEVAAHYERARKEWWLGLSPEERRVLNQPDADTDGESSCA